MAPCHCPMDPCHRRNQSKWRVPTPSVNILSCALRMLLWSSVGGRRHNFFLTSKWGARAIFFFPSALPASVGVILNLSRGSDVPCTPVTSPYATLCIRMHMCTSICICAHLYAYACIYMHMHAYRYACTSIHLMHMHAYTYTHTFIPPPSSIQHAR